MICRLILVKIYNSMSLSVLFVYTFIISDQHLLKNHYNGWLIWNNVNHDDTKIEAEQYSGDQTKRKNNNTVILEHLLET